MSDSRPIAAGEGSRHARGQGFGGHRVGGEMRPMFFAMALSMVALSGPRGRADNSEVCQKAASILGKHKAKLLSASECQQALESSEEEQWQLWLDMAGADEQAGNPEKAIGTLTRFVESADLRGARLAPNWAHVRDEARTTLDRLDTDLLKKKARVTFRANPESANVTFPKGVQGTPERTPVTKYFEPGAHVARVFDDASQKSREVTFTVEKGQRVVLKVDLLTDAPSGAGVLESEGPPVIGQDPRLAIDKGGPDKGGPDKTGPDTAGPDKGGPDGGSNTILEKDLDTERPPIAPPPRMWDRIGAAAIGLGVAGLAAGAVFLAEGLRLDDNAACSGNACLFDQAQRARIKDEAGVYTDRSIAGFVIGAVFVAGGLTALFLPKDAPPAIEPPDKPKGAPKDGVDPKAPPKDPKSDKTGLRGITPWIGPDGAGLGATFAF